MRPVLIAVAVGFTCSFAPSTLLAGELRPGAAPASPASVIDSLVVWSTLLGGPGEYERVITAVDPGGDIIAVMGTTDPAWIGDLTSSIYHYGAGGGIDMVVLRLNGAGDVVHAAAVIGGPGSDDGAGATGVGVLSDGTIVICGSGSTGFPTTPGAYDSVLPGGIRYKATLVRLTADLDTLLYSTYYGGNGSESEFHGMALGPGDRIVTCGRTDSPDFPATAGAYDTVHGGGRDGFVAVFTTACQPTHATLFGGGAQDELLRVALDPVRHEVVAGGYSASSGLAGALPAYDAQLDGPNDGVLVSFSEDLASRLRFTYLGSSLNVSELIYSLKLDDDGGPVAVLNTTGPGLPIVPGSWPVTTGGARDPYVFKLAPDWSGVAWGTYAGGSANDEGYALQKLVCGEWALAGYSELLDMVTTVPRVGADHGAMLAFLDPATATIPLVFSPAGNIGFGLTLQSADRLLFSGDVTSGTGFPFYASRDSSYGGGETDGFLMSLRTYPPCTADVGTPAAGSSPRAVALAVAVVSTRADIGLSTIRIDQAEPGDVDLGLFDAAGRKLWWRRLPRIDDTSRLVALEWDGLAHGTLSNGIYFVTARSGSARASTRILVMR